MSTVASSRSRRELAYRVSGSIEITLYWRPEDDSTSIEVRQQASGERIAFAVPGADALDAFYHPFVHLPLSIDERSPALEQAHS